MLKKFAIKFLQKEVSFDECVVKGNLSGVLPASFFSNNFNFLFLKGHWFFNLHAEAYDLTGDTFSDQHRKNRLISFIYDMQHRPDRPSYHEVRRCKFS
jgi:hypothetical protein